MYRNKAKKWQKWKTQANNLKFKLKKVKERNAKTLRLIS